MDLKELGRRGRAKDNVTPMSVRPASYKAIRLGVPPGRMKRLGDRPDDGAEAAALLLEFGPANSM